MADLVHIQTRTRAYFDAWNARDNAKLKELFEVHVKLTDWQTSEQGIEAVLKANHQIWKDLPNVQISIKNIFISSNTCPTAACEIEVELNDETSTVLNVVDILEFSASANITAVRAYKQ